MAFTWTDENKAEVVTKYEDSSPTPENSMEIVKSIAEEIGATPNGVRTILSRAEVYIKKVTAKPAASSSSGSTRVSKADALGSLHTAIEALGLEPDESITSKLTGKAAMYFAEVIKSTTQSED